MTLDGGRDVISRRKVMPPGKYTHNVCPAPMQQRPPFPDNRAYPYLLCYKSAVSASMNYFFMYNIKYKIRALLLLLLLF